MRHLAVTEYLEVNCKPIENHSFTMYAAVWSSRLRLSVPNDYFVIRNGISFDAPQRNVG